MSQKSQINKLSDMILGYLAENDMIFPEVKGTANLSFYADKIAAHLVSKKVGTEDRFECEYRIIEGQGDVATIKPIKYEEKKCTNQ